MIPILKAIPKTIWKVWFLLYMIASTLFFYPFLLVTILVLKNYDLTYRIYRIWAVSICIAIGVIPLAKGIERLPAKGPYIIVANHSSELDIIVPYTKIKSHFAFLAKEELKKAPLFNINFKGMNVTVNRRSMLSGKHSMKECLDKIDQKINLLIFPEGTRSGSAPTMSRFKNGPFSLAVESNAPIVPVVFHDNYKRLGGGKGFFLSHASPGISRMTILDPIHPKDAGNSIDELSMLVRKAMEKAQKS